MILTQLEHGGAQTAMLHLKRELEAKGHLVKMVFLYAKDAAAYPGKDFVCLANSQPKLPHHALTLLWRLSRVWRDFGPSHVMARTHYSVLFMAALKALGHGGKAIAIQANVASYPPMIARIGDWIAGSLGLYAKNVCVSAATARTFDSYPARYRKHICVIDNGVDMPEREIEREQARQEFGLPQGLFILGNCGRLVQQKNQGFLVQLLTHLPQVHLAIAGDGPDRDALVELAQSLGVADRVMFLGAVPHARMGTFYSALDLFLLPSLYEGRSNGLLEAMSFGLPVIGNDVPTIREALLSPPQIRAGDVVPLDAQEWVRLISRLSADEKRMRELGESSRLRAQGFSMQACGEAYLRMLADL